MKHSILGLLLLSLVAAGAELSFEQTAEKRLREILGTQSIQKDTRHGGRLTMIDVPDSSREEVHSELSRLFLGLRRLATRDAVRVLAGFLNDDRYIYDPGSDYGSATIAEEAERALDAIHREHSSIVPGAPWPDRAPDPSDSKAWSEWVKSKDRLRIDAWRKWWAKNKASYEHAAPAAQIPK
jgi:hypothetical protein